MKIGITGSGNIGAAAAGLFARAGTRSRSATRAGAKRKVASLIEDVGFAAVDTGTLGEGGRRQQVGTAVYDKELNAREAAEILSAV